MTPPQQGDVVFFNNWIVTINAIAPRQKRGMCARLMFADGSGWWLPVAELRPFGLNAHAWQYED